jgi:hypothetical protein
VTSVTVVLAIGSYDFYLKTIFNFIFITIERLPRSPFIKKASVYRSYRFAKPVLLLQKVFLSCLLLVAPLAFAGDLGSIAGTVSDPSGAVIPGAVVVLHSASETTPRSTTATADGTYSFAGVPAGDYEVEAADLPPTGKAMSTSPPMRLSISTFNWRWLRRRK